MSALKLSPTGNDRFAVDQTGHLLDARRLRSRAFAAFAADTVVALSRSVATLVARFKAWNERRATFAELEGLDDRILADIGLSRSEIAQVAAGHYVRDQHNYRKEVRPADQAAANFDDARRAA